MPGISHAVVFVVDDDPAVRAALDALLRSAGWLVETFGAAEEFLERPKALVPHCLVLDLEMPGVGGLELQEQVVRNYPFTPVIFITGHGDIPKTVRAMKAGAVEFLTKPFEDDAVITSIEQAIAKSAHALHRGAQRNEVAGRYASLTPRERQVMLKVVQGLLNKQIAADLGIAEGTVKIHRSQVMIKMKVESLADLVKLARHVPR